MKATTSEFLSLFHVFLFWNTISDSLKRKPNNVGIKVTKTVRKQFHVKMIGVFTR